MLNISTILKTTFVATLLICCRLQGLRPFRYSFFVFLELLFVSNTGLRPVQASSRPVKIEIVRTNLLQTFEEQAPLCLIQICMLNREQDFVPQSCSLSSSVHLLSSQGLCPCGGTSPPVPPSSSSTREASFSRSSSP